VACSCEQVYETSGSIRSGEFDDKLSDFTSDEGLSFMLLIKDKACSGFDFGSWKNVTFSGRTHNGNLAERFCWWQNTGRINNSMEQSPIQLAKKFHAFCRNKWFITMTQKSTTRPCPELKLFPLRPILITLLHLRLGLPIGLFPS